MNDAKTLKKRRVSERDSDIGEEEDFAEGDLEKEEMRANAGNPMKVQRTEKED